jgi:hypothetical protein
MNVRMVCFLHYLYVSMYVCKLICYCGRLQQCMYISTYVEYTTLYEFTVMCGCKYQKYVDYVSKYVIIITWTFVRTYVCTSTLCVSVSIVSVRMFVSCTYVRDVKSMYRCTHVHLCT